MKKKSLIKNLSLIGLTLTVTSCDKQLENNPLNNENYSFPTRSPQGQRMGFTPIVELNLPDSINNHIIALSTLAFDVFENPLVAQLFSQDPQSYFNSKGLQNCNIDMNSGEIKAIIALGDKEIREAISLNDISKFLRLLEEKNYITFDNAYFNGSLTKYFESELTNNSDFQDVLKNLPLSTISKGNANLVFLSPAIFIHFMLIYTQIEVNPIKEPDFPVDLSYSTAKSLTGFDFNNPVLKIWGLETNSNDIYVVNELIEKKIDEIVDVFENFILNKNFTFNMSREDLKTWIRKPVTQYFIEVGLI